MSQDKESAQCQKKAQIKQYRCFCAKNYNSYAGLYLHLKSKHEDAFTLYKNMKISKLLSPMHTDSSKVVFKLKEPTKEKSERSKSPADKVADLKFKPPNQQESRPSIKDQQFYTFRPQQLPINPINYCPTLSAQPYMFPGQAYYSNPVRDFPISNQAITFNSHSPYDYYQFPTHFQPQQQTPVYTFPTQPISNPYFVTNGIPYWPSGPYTQPTVKERPVENKNQPKRPQNGLSKAQKMPADITGKQKSKADQRKVKLQHKSYLTPQDQSIRNKSENGQANICSDRTKTPQPSLI